MAQLFLLILFLSFYSFVNEVVTMLRIDRALPEQTAIYGHKSTKSFEPSGYSQMR
jgi:hypothetical protein